MRVSTLLLTSRLLCGVPVAKWSTLKPVALNEIGSPLLGNYKDLRHVEADRAQPGPHKAPGFLDFVSRKVTAAGWK